ncbi:SMI1/KNR4 family protein [Kroppenstedtia sanguinis]|uniref:SMI1/KNR4 family protein n=1 Tax=Kroppenstedtia sanguinis TaxID=1380684 RepID=A0ABW4C6Y2_9BACL
MVEIKWIENAEIDKVSDEELAQIERQLGVKLPSNFIAFCERYDAPQEYVLIDDVNGDTYELSGFYTLKMIAEEVNDIYTQDEDLKDIDGIVVPFAFDSVISQYFFFYKRDNLEEPAGIFFRNTDDSFNEALDENRYISKTFQELLEKLYIGEDI